LQEEQADKHTYVLYVSHNVTICLTLDINKPKVSKLVSKHLSLLKKKKKNWNNEIDGY